MYGKEFEEAKIVDGKVVEAKFVDGRVVSSDDECNDNDNKEETKKE